MQIVIDFPEHAYRYLAEIANAGYEHLGYFERAILNGTPLPKGHGDLIDREKTVKRICKVAEFMNEKREKLGSPFIMAALFIQDNKEEFPTIIEADAEKEAKNE